MFDKEIRYYSDIRWDVIELIQDGKNRILEIGCGAGNTGKALKHQGKAIEVIGIEKVPEIAEMAKANIDKVICADIETVELPFSEGYFDYVIIADALEHLYNPWALVNKLGRYIKKGGHIITSIPNIRNWRIIIHLVLKGEWNYGHHRLLDDTHIRFFTKKSMIRLLQSGNFVVNCMIPRFKFQPRNPYNIVNRLTLGLLEDFLTTQYIIKAKNA